MRNLIVTAVALAPLMAATGVQAQVVISNARTTPIATSTATGTAPDDIRIASGGSIAVTSGNAVTVDTSDSIDLDSGSSITMTNAADGATAVQVNGGNAANVTIGGAISVTDSITTYPDTDMDGDLDGPFATGTGRYGVRLSGAAPVTGNVLVESGGSILVEGNNSYGISVETGLVGNLTTLGGVRAIGDNAVAVRTTAPVTGNIRIGAATSALGLNASGVSIGGDVSGRLTLQGEIASTGYRYTARPNDTFIGRLEPDDLLQGGSAVIVTGNVGGGIVLDRPPVVPTPPTGTTPNPDSDGDGVPDASEGTANVATFGQAPAVAIGASTGAITIGVAGTGDDAYGFINRGQVTASGVYDGVSATGIRFGTDSGQGVLIQGGVRNEGSVSALAEEADATAVRFSNGATTTRFDNTGTISAGVASDVVRQVGAVRIEQGANVQAFTNSGGVLATSGNSSANVTALQDLSGTLSSITNTRSIQATLGASAAGAAVTGTTTAIDVRANTTGMTLTQRGTANAPTATDPDADGDGVSDSFEPIINGDVLLGSGADLVDVRNGVVLGDIAFGAGADRLAVTGGGVVRGAITDGDGQLSIDVANGVLDARQTSSTAISSLNVGAAGDLIFTIDPAANQSAGFVVSGNANIADGAGLGVRFNSLIQNPTRFTVIDAGSLTVGAIDQTTVQGNSPYLFVTSASANVAAGEVYIDARRRTADEADLILVESQAFDAVYDGLAQNDAIREAFLSQTDREGFINLYEQALPDHSGGPLLSLASGVDAVTRALTGRNASAAPGETSAWVQEINFYADKDKTDTYGFRSEGFGVAGGIERGTGVGAFGLSVAFTSSDLEDPEAEAEEVLSASLVELGLYWRAQSQNWTTWARAAGGYATFDATRRLVGEGLNLSNESEWNGFSLALAGGASYERNFGRLNVRPEVYAEYFGLSEDSRVEEGGGDGFDLEIDERDGHLFAATAAVNVGYGFGQNGWLRPELRVGWRQNISVDPGETIARFASGGSDFRLTPDTIEGGGPIAGLRLGVGNELGLLSIAADAELIEDYVRYTLLLRASFRF